MKAQVIKTGVPGFDEVLNGGLPRNHSYLFLGKPGAGKTPLSLQFLLEGARQGERGLYVPLSETKEELLEIAASHGWNLDKLSILELSEIQQKISPSSQNTLFPSMELELNQTMQVLQEKIDEAKPDRLVLDSMSEIRLLAQEPLRYRREILI